MAKILVIEDELLLLEAIKAKLKFNSFDVVTARTVDQALEYLENVGTFDAIWLDHYLLESSKSGLDLVSEIKKGNSAWKNTPIFVVTNTAGPDEQKLYLEMGVTKYYIKAETRLDQVIKDIKEFLEKSKQKGRKKNR